MKQNKDQTQAGGFNLCFKSKNLIQVFQIRVDFCFGDCNEEFSIKNMLPSNMCLHVYSSPTIFIDMW